MEKQVRAHVFIKGQVQGVFYRAWAQEQAQSLDLTGWVRNLNDGRVEAVFEGEKGKVEKMIERCRQGPSIASVEHADVIWEEATGEFSEFGIIM